MLAWLLLVASTSAPLERMAANLQKTPAWQAEFSQVFLPSGLTQGAEEGGVVTFAHPSRLRFDYRTEPQRVFAVDGPVARMVDPEAGTCHAVALSEGAWASLPLAALADPGSLQTHFQVEEESSRIVLIPKKPSPELAQVEVSLGSDGLPQLLVVEDGSGNRNKFRFSRWRAVKTIEPRLFSPSLPGQPPCLPRDDNPGNRR